MTEKNDYEKILSDLQEERANIERMIAWVKKKLYEIDPSQSPTVEQLLEERPKEIMRFPRLKQDTFFKMSFQQAIRECLNLNRRPMSARDITRALQEGGLTHKAKDLYQTVFPALMRMKQKGEVDKVPNGDWALADWYRQKNTQAQSDEEK
jgi:hypothetical protein